MKVNKKAAPDKFYPRTSKEEKIEKVKHLTALSNKSSAT